MSIDINVQNVMILGMNESDARGEDDMGKRSRSVFRLHLKLSMVGNERISRGIKLQIMGAAERKE